MKPFISSFLVVALLPAPLAAEAVSRPLGIVFRSEEAAFNVPFHNRATGDVWITGAETSCDCLQPRFGLARIPAGEKVELAFALRPGTLGSFSITTSLRGRSAQETVQTILVTGFVAERDWLIAPDQLNLLLSTEPVTVFDVRRAEPFAQARIPRSLNVPAFALKSRTALRERRIVLVDDGSAPDVLLEHAMHLRKLGFANVTIVEGGLPAWIRAGLPVEGSVVSILAAATMSAADFLRARSTAEWILIDVAGGEARSERPDGAVRVAGCDEVEELLLARNASRRTPYVPNALVMAPDLGAYAHVEARLSRSNIGSVYYLAGGSAALESHLAAQATVADSGRPILQTRSARAHGPAAAGCGSCPK